jgi:hypothetical protein
MSDQQFKVIVVHLRVLIVTTGIQAGVLVALAWAYL